MTTRIVEPPIDLEAEEAYLAKRTTQIIRLLDVRMAREEERAKRPEPKPAA